MKEGDEQKILMTERAKASNKSTCDQTPKNEIALPELADVKNKSPSIFSTKSHISSPEDDCEKKKFLESPFSQEAKKGVCSRMSMPLMYDKHQKTLPHFNPMNKPKRRILLRNKKNRAFMIGK